MTRQSRLGLPCAPPAPTHPTGSLDKTFLFFICALLSSDRKGPALDLADYGRIKYGLALCTRGIVLGKFLNRPYACIGF